MVKKDPNSSSSSDKKTKQAENASTQNINIGIKDSDRHKISAGLSQFLADAFTLYLKTHSAHWNVTGPHFSALHTMFETQYTEQWTALDAVAERIRALGYLAPGSYQDFTTLTSIQESKSPSCPQPWENMVTQLVAYNEAVCQSARTVLQMAEKGNDAASADLLTERIHVHEKYAWMLRTLLQ